MKKNDPSNDLLVPLNDAIPSPHPLTSSSKSIKVPGAQSPHVRSRRNTIGSDDMGEKVSKMKIGLDDDNKKGAFNRNYLNPDFKYNMEMALRVAFGVVIASFIQTKWQHFNALAPVGTKEHDKRWVLFPEWYYLGGLSYCAVAVIFSAQKTVGATTREMCQAFYGVGMALIYNIILFSIIDVHKSSVANPPEDQPFPGFVEIKKNFGTSTYWVNNHNFYTVLPWIMIFTVVILVIPIETNTKKFALGNNLYFSLTIINPMDPTSTQRLKVIGDHRFSTGNILKNLELYFLVGFIGTFISFVVMFIPYPVFAISKLREETRKASEDILDLLNIIIDSYCFKNKNVDHMNFLRVKLKSKFDNVLDRHRRMNALVEDVWWEQLFGFHVLLKFNRSMIKTYVKLVGSLISDVRTLNNAMQLEKYESLHFQYMNSLQREIYLIQVRSGDLLNEISANVHDCVEHMELASIAPLESQMERTLHRYKATQNRILRTQKVSLKDVEGNVPLNLFLFSLNSMCSTLIDFQKQHNEKEYDTGKRVGAFVIKTIKSFFDPAKYNRLTMISAFKASLAIFAGTMLAVYVYAFSHTTPNAVAFVMGSHIGGSFSVTMNRVGGVVAGSVVPSVFQFFIAQICNPSSLGVALSDIVLFFWVAGSMYVRYSGGYASYAGLVSAFIAAGVLLKQTDTCGGAGATAQLAVSSYSNMAQTSVGILLFIIVELALCPESASRLLRQNIVDSLEQLQKAFTILFSHHMASTNEISEDTMEEVRKILQDKLPAMLAEQTKLLTEANSEPMLWKPPFSYTKYESVLDSCFRLLNNNNILYKLVRWYAYRVKNEKVDTTNTVDIRDAQNASERALMDEESTHNRWMNASNKFQNSVDETFDTLQVLFGEDFIYADQEQTALFMQMKEAFRVADKDGSGEIDADEVAVMLEAIFAQVGGMNEGEIQDYVERFMEIVDHDQSGKVSFEEFTKALDDGLRFDVEVYTRRKTKATVLKDKGKAGLSTISEEHSATGDRSSASQSATTPKVRRSSIPAAPTPTDGTRGVTAITTPKRKLAARASTLHAPGSPMMRRQHDVLNVSDFSLGEIAGEMKSAYVQWLMEDKRFEKVSMEELLLLNCLVSGAEGIARQLTAIEEIVVSH